MKIRSTFALALGGLFFTSVGSVEAQPRNDRGGSTYHNLHNPSVADYAHKEMSGAQGRHDSANVVDETHGYNLYGLLPGGKKDR